jgi:iron complex outermembrane receptor protein
VRPLVIAVASAVLVLAPVVVAPYAQAAEPTASNATKSYSIPAGPLAGVLNQFAGESGIFLSADGSLTSGGRSAGVQGTFTVQQALNKILAGTGLEAVAQPNGSYVLRKLPSSAEVTLPLVQVSGSAEQEDAWGPVKGYVAKRSASGTKTDTPIIETPQSITVIGAEEIETLKSQSIQDALGYAAGVSRFEAVSRVQDTIYLRGFQAQAGTGSIYRDGGKYTVNAFNGKQEIYGMERIELLKGAASVMYGSAGPGGVINMVSKRPTTTPLRELNVELGSFNRKQISGDFAGALDDAGEWSYRLTFLERKSDTFVDYVGDDRTFIAPAIKWQPNATTSFTLLTDYQKDKTNYVYGLPAQGTVLPNIFGPIPRNRFTGEPGYSKFDATRYSIGYLFEHAFNDQLKLRNSLRYFHSTSDFPQVWASDLAADQRTTAYRGGTLRWERSSSLVADTSLEYKLNHGDVKQTLLFGVDYTRQKNQSERYDRTAGDLDYYQPVYGGALGAPTPFYGWSYNSDSTQLGLYAQDQIKFKDKWVVLLGGRYDHVRYNQSDFFTGSRDVDNEKNRAFTGRAGLVYLADNGLAPFISFSESFEPTTGRDRLGKRFDPSTGQQYEIGVRYQPKGSDTLISAAIYELTKQNVTVQDPVNPTFEAQIGEVRSRGFELEARTRIGKNTNLIAVYGYTDARTTKASPLQPSQVGQRSPGIPYNQFSIWGDYSFANFGLPTLKLGGGMRYQSETKPNAGKFEVPSFTVFDAMVSYTSGPWRFALNINNLTDKTYIGSCTMGCFYGEPRKVISTATYRW